MRVTLKQIAADVGVTPMTVSNAFNRPDQLSAELRERILERAQALGYAGRTRSPAGCAEAGRARSGW